MTAIEYLKYLNEHIYLPASTEGSGTGKPSNSELKRWLKNKSVIINGKVASSQDEIEFPVWELVFFPKGKRRTTMIYSGESKCT